ncbi:MAG: hypothetical protein P8188_04885 [Gemmatimonadota bacterium]|jgi:hypothetical protein
MNPSFTRLGLVALVLVSLSPQPVFGYIGPGSGLSAIGAVLAVVAGLFFALFGFVWYPVKRLLRSMKKSEAPAGLTEEGGRTE